MNRQSGFTFVEVLVVTAVLSIMAAVIILPVYQGLEQSRDADRQTDLSTLASAIELYKLENGRYPEGCNPSSGMDVTNDSHWLGVWSGQKGSGYDCIPASGEYIIGLAPEFIPVLPTDPKLNIDETYSGYVYTTNPEGTVYKLMALNTVEDEIVTYLHPLSRCGDINLGSGANGNECAIVPTPTGFYPNTNPSCGTYNCFGSQAPSCDTSEINNDYAVWGGYASGGRSGMWRDSEKAREYFSDQIRCK